MTDEFSTYDYLRYVQAHWRIPVSGGIVAVVLSLAISLLIPKQYTAQSSVMIDFPGSSDPRLSIGVSAVYLESLKSYERLASGDSVFASLVDKFQLQKPGSVEPIESLKKRVLQVSKIRDTRVLEIRVTLPDPVIAQQCAQYIAEQAVRLSREENVASDRDVMDNLNRQLQSARERVGTAQKNQLMALNGLQAETLQGEAEVTVESLTKSQQALEAALADVAELEQRSATASVAVIPVDEGKALEVELHASRARAASLRTQVSDLKREYEQTSGLLSSQSVRNQQIQTELESAQAAYATAQAHMNDHGVEGGGRGERLRIIDPGIVPQRPSSPNIPMNLFAALVLSFALSCVYTALGFAKRLNTPQHLRESFSIGS